MNIRVALKRWIVVGALSVVAGCGGTNGRSTTSTPPATGGPSPGGSTGGAMGGSDGGMPSGGSPGGQAGGSDGGAGSGGTPGSGGSTGTGGGSDGGTIGDGGSTGTGGGVTIHCSSADPPIKAGGLTFRHEMLPAQAAADGYAVVQGFAPDAQHVWIQFDGDLLRSAGDGCWREATPAGAGAVTAIGGSSAQDLVAMTTRNSVVSAFHSTDGGATWTSHTLGYVTGREVGSIAFAGATAYAGPYLAGNEWDLAISSDGFATATTEIAPRFGSRLYYAGALFDYGSNLADNQGEIERSSDGGKTWTLSQLCGSPFSAGVNGMSGSPASLWALCHVDGKNHSGSVVYHSTDDGLTWTTVRTGLTLESGTAIHAAGNSVWIAAPHVTSQTLTTDTLGERVAYSTDGGATFSTMALPSDASMSPMGIVGSSADDIVIVMPDATVWHGRKE